MHALKALPSNWQRKLAPVCVSVKLKLAVVRFVGFAGFAVIVGVGGGVVLIVHVKAGGGALITRSVLSLHRERMTALTQARVNSWTRARAERAAIQLTEETHPRLRIRKAETRVGLIRRIRRRRGDRRRRWRRSVNVQVKLVAGL